VTHRKDRLAEAEKFGAVVRTLREKRGLTQEQLAERAEMSATYLGFIERGDNVPTLIIILQIASALGVRPAELLRDF
jgi:transcriptional regulator with XRE-family HTH domain